MRLNKTILTKVDNKDVIAYNVTFENGFEVEVLNLGGIITKVITPDKNGKLENIVVGYKDIESYITNPSYLGAIIGRTSGRICEGVISIEGNEYNLAKNYDPHQGHGGNIGFDKKIWDVEAVEEENLVTLKMFTTSNHLEENYPGNLLANVIFKIKKSLEIEITYEATTDQTTLVNMTNHSYFNLSGDIKSPVTEQVLKLDSDYILEIDNTCATTGNKIEVLNTPFDFRKATRIGNSIDDTHEQIQIGCGYDHTFVLNDNPNQMYLEDNKSGRAMSIDTNQKCAVIYSMNFPDNEILYNGKSNQRRFGICFETQAPPIGRNMCFLEDSLLSKDNKYIHKTKYKFSII